MSKIKVYTTENNEFSTVANTYVEIDGKKIPYCTSFKLELKAGGIAKATIELVGNFEVDLDGVEVDFKS